MKKILLAFTLIFTIIFANSLAFAESKAADKKFTDIDKHWAKDAINKIADKDLFSGKDGKFQPDKAITRSEFVLMLQKALGIQIMYFKATDIREYYDDVKNEDIYASALYDLVTAGIIDYEDHFKPDSTLAREEMVHFTMNAYRYKMGDKYAMINLVANPFADENKQTPEYNGDIARAEHYGIITRPGSNMFRPKDSATKAQAATVIYRLSTLLEKENLQVSVVPYAEVKDDALNMKLIVTNNTKSQIVINHNSGQKFDFKVLDAGSNILYTWSADKMFISALTNTVLEPGKSAEFSANVEKDIFAGMKEKAVYVKAYITGSSDGFNVNAGGYEAAIR